MKKTLLTLFVAVMTAMTASAQNGYNEGVNDIYDGKIVVTINGISSNLIDAHVVIEKNTSAEENNKINFVLKNFMLIDEESSFPIGNVKISDILLTYNESTELLEFTKQENITIEPGDDPNIDEGMWLGPVLGEVPVNIHGEAFLDYMDIDIDIDMMASLGQAIHVDFYAGEKQTGIQNAMRSSQTSTAAYNLAGQQINADAKGIIIKNGKKFIK